MVRVLACVLLELRSEALPMLDLPESTSGFVCPSTVSWRLKKSLLVDSDFHGLSRESCWWVYSWSDEFNKCQIAFHRLGECFDDLWYCGAKLFLQSKLAPWHFSAAIPLVLLFPLVNNTQIYWYVLHLCICNIRCVTRFPTGEGTCTQRKQSTRSGATPETVNCLQEVLHA